MTLSRPVLWTVAACALVAGCATPPPPPAPAPAPMPAPAPQPPAPPPVSVIDGNAWTPRMAQLGRDLQALAPADGSVEIERTERNEWRLRGAGAAAFQARRVALSPQFAGLLDALADKLKAEPSLRVLVLGHTDSQGSDAVNLRISQQRAQAAVDHLVARGIAADRLRAEGRGESEPVADNDTANNRALNRRVELLVSDPAPAR